MADNLTSLFGNECAGQGISGELALCAQQNRPLTKVQRTINRLVGKIETLRAALARETRRLDEALAKVCSAIQVFRAANQGRL